MLHQPTLEKLLAMRLTGMVEALKEQEREEASAELSFWERLGQMVDRQLTWRQNLALQQRLKRAKLRASVCLEDVDWRAARGLDKSVILALTEQSCWVRQHDHIFLTGPTGVGKSFLACALAQKACRDGFTATYTRATSLFRDLAIARADGSLRRFLGRLSRMDVLVIDDWAMTPLTSTEARDFWEICEDRYQRSSTILTAQMPVAKWHEQIGIRRWRMGSWTVWCTTRIASSCGEIRCARGGSRPSAEPRARGFCGTAGERDGCPFPQTPIPATGGRPSLRSGWGFCLTIPISCRTIRKPASLRIRGLIGGEEISDRIQRKTVIGIARIRTIGTASAGCVTPCLKRTPQLST